MLRLISLNSARISLNSALVNLNGTPVSLNSALVSLNSAQASLDIRLDNNCKGQNPYRMYLYPTLTLTRSAISPFCVLSTPLIILIEGKTRKVKLDENFFTGYRRTVLQPSEVLVDIFIPFTEKVH